MKMKMLMILFALISVAATVEDISKVVAEKNTSTIVPTYSLWCVSNDNAFSRRVRRYLRWACKNGADCSPLQKGGQCQDLEYYRSRASYAFNDYYQKDPIPKNCDFDGVAVLTIQDPSTPTCKFPSNSTGPFPLSSLVTRTEATNIGSLLLWGLGLAYVAYVAAHLA